MNPTWNTFLTEKGAILDNSNLHSFDSSESLLVDLSHRGLIKVCGEDAESFLQNQFTNEIHNISETSHQISAWCSPKGRIIANFRIFKQDDCYLLSLSSDLVEHVIKKLQMYVMMSKVTLEDVSDSLAQFGLLGKSAEQTLNKLLSSEDIKLPNKTSEAAQYKSSTILKISDSPTRFEVFSSISDAKEIWEKLSFVSIIGSSDYWDYFNIQAGLPQISEASSEAWIPQMVNFIAINGVDFKKGCYPGQEVVARLNYLGKTKRRMYRLLIDTDALPEINEDIASESDQKAGKILNAVITPKGQIEALAILKIAEAENTLSLASNSSASIKLLELPYSLEEQ